VKRILVLVLTFYSTLVFSDDAARLLQSKLNEFKSMTASFSQVVKSKKQILQRSSGKFWLQRPGKFRWYTLSPLKQLIVADGKILWIYDKDLEQVTKKKQAKLGGTPALFLSGFDDALQRDFAVKNRKIRSSQSFELTPKNSHTNFSKVLLVFKKDKLAQIQLTDLLGQVTSVTLKNTRLNPAISSKLFYFKPPKGVDVINQ
jgi:outer membrane lipoprotein carrier protein